MKWVSYTRSISSRIGEENPSNTIAEQNERIAQYLKKRGSSISEKYSDRKRTAEATEGFDKLVQDGMARKFDAVAVDSIFRCGRTLPFAIEALQRTFYPLGIQFAVVEDDFCSADKTAEEVAEYFNGKTIDKIRSEFITNRQNHFEEGTLTHRQAKYGYALSEDRRNLVLNPESAQVVKLIFQMYLEDMKIPEI
ncbi:MAG: recombinase family protein, partial [Blautia obeum]